MNELDRLSNFLPMLQNKYILEYDAQSSNDKTIVLRSTISSGIEAESFVKDFSDATNSNWIVYRARPHFTRLIFQKSWVCQHSRHRKRSLSKRNLECRAKLFITIKKVTKHTRRKDPYLCAAVPLNCKIVINSHNHDLNDADILKMKRVSDEVQKQFFAYFDAGINPKNAKRYHESILCTSENSNVDLIHAAKIPSDRQVYYMYEMWCKMNSEPDFKKLTRKMQLYKERELFENVNSVILSSQAESKIL